jgi:hypothetical protein
MQNSTFSQDSGGCVVDKRKHWEARVEMAVFKLPSGELSTYDKLVYAILCGHANREGNARLYVATIAAEASCSTRQVRRALTKLESCHLLARRFRNIPGRGQTCNIYEVYGYDEYTPSREREQDVPDPQEAEPQNCNETASSALTSPQHQPVPPRPSGQAALPASQPPADRQADEGIEQLLKNKKDRNTIPPNPPSGQGEEEAPPKPERKTYDTENREELLQSQLQPQSPGQTGFLQPKPAPEAELHETIRRLYNTILPELAPAERITAARENVLRQRIREDPVREKFDWWKWFFSRVRKFPWPMGNNESRWRASFDWLIEEKGMQKILEGSFRRSFMVDSPAFDLHRPAIRLDVSPETRELWDKYRDRSGKIDVPAMLRDARRNRASQ